MSGESLEVKRVSPLTKKKQPRKRPPSLAGFLFTVREKFPRVVGKPIVIFSGGHARGWLDLTF